MQRKQKDNKGGIQLFGLGALLQFEVQETVWLL